jgi:hypothetical protein
MLLKQWVVLALLPDIGTWLAHAMWSKRSKEYEDLKDAPDKRFRHNMCELFLDSSVSGTRVESLLEDAQVAGTRHVADLVPHLKKKMPKKNDKKKRNSHAHRDILRRLLKGNPWPPLYYAKIQVWSPKHKSEIEVLCPFFLPHEILARLWAANKSTDMLHTAGMSTTCHTHLLKMKEQFQVEHAVALGLWIDGCPCNWDRTQSVEVFSLNFPGFANENSKLRIPLCAVMKKYVATQKTYDQILAVLAWSITWASCGQFPARRHDGSPFGKLDKLRIKKAGQTLGCSGFLSELRGDWKMLKETFAFPSWNEKAGCCFKCNVTPTTLRDFGRQAAWKRLENRLSHWQLMQRIVEKGHCISPLFSCPGFHSGLVAIDWLHCCDLGVAADFLGNLFNILVPKQAGRTKDEKLANFFKRIQLYYVEEGVSDVLDDLTWAMIQKKATSSPKLRAKAAEARKLVPFARLEAARCLSGGKPEEVTAMQAAVHLEKCYNCLSNYDTVTLQNESTHFLLLYKALEEHAVSVGSCAWKVKPKFHIWQELCNMPDNPVSHWVYRDEDFGGYVAQVAKRKGGKNTVRATGEQVLNKFRAKHTLQLR